jgi:hypothetical protein
MTRLYQVISFHEGREPEWDGTKEVFSPHARITRVTPEGTDHLDLATFCAMARQMLDAGAYTGFHEREVSSIQLVNEDGVWRVVSLCWDEEGMRGPGATP